MVSHPSIHEVKLLSIDRHDREKLRRWRNDPKVYKWCRQNDLLDFSNHDDWFDNFAKDRSIRMYKINNGSTDIGICGLTDLDLVNQRAEFSIYIAPEHHGAGYAAVSLKLLLWHGFNAYPLNVIWGETYKGNPAFEIFKKVGFKEEGVRRDFYFRDGKHIDAHLISIKRKEFLGD